MYYFNKSWCTKITSTSASRISSFVSNHKEADTKLVALVNAFNSSGSTIYWCCFFYTNSKTNECWLIMAPETAERLLIWAPLISSSYRGKNWLAFMHLVEMIMFRVSSETGRKILGRVDKAWKICSDICRLGLVWPCCEGNETKRICLSDLCWQEM